MAKTPKSYTPAPQVAAQDLERVRVITEVIAGRCSVSDGARLLGLSRNRFQTLLHRGLSGMVESITPHPPGRPCKPAEVLELQARLDRLERENVRLQEQVATSQRVLEVASELLQGRIRPVRAKRSRKTAAPGDEEGGEAEPARGLEGIERMRRCGLTASAAARMAGVHEATARRWRAHHPEGRAQRCCHLPDARAGEQAAALVRKLHGQVGAEALRRSVANLSRRQAARIKAQTLTAMERSRKAQSHHVQVSVPGLVRGIDAMHLRSAEGTCYALIAADACVPYRTSVKVAKRYDAKLVARTLAADIEAHGAPLVYRMDRAKAHDAKAVRELLEAHRVLVLHGPPHYPRFYGQLERQNREHRAWQEDVRKLPTEQVEGCLREALAAVNSSWRRRTLDWRTASEAWQQHDRIEVDREKFRCDVKQRAARIGRHLQHRGKPADLAQRLAIEQALKSRGYLRQTIGGRC